MASLPKSKSVSMTFKEKIGFWLLRWVLGPSVHQKGPLPRSIRAEVNMVNQVAYESIIQSLAQKSMRAQLIFLHMYVKNMTPEMTEQMMRYSFYITRENETGYVNSDAVKAARSRASRDQRRNEAENQQRRDDIFPSDGLFHGGAFPPDVQ